MTGAPDRCRCGTGFAAAPLFEVVSATSAARTMLLRCGACGALFPQSLPPSQEAERLYDVGPLRRGPWRRLARRLLDVTRPSYVDRATPAAARRILDFGCGAGGYLAGVAMEGREAFGVDPIEPRDAGGAWRWIAVEDMKRFGPFDWITLGHVLEHLDDPAGVLRRLRTMLTPDGGLWIATPNADSFIFGVARADARDIDYPRHREIFTRIGLEDRLAAAGLSVTWLSPPRVNALLNVATTAGQMGGGPWRAARLWLALAIHMLKPRRDRDRDSPELVAVCRIRSTGSPPAR